MDSQDQRKTSPTGHESHGVHLCHKCGWPFPNPHPSAKHRRAHKRICGTLEGYKLIDSEEHAHSSISDDEHEHGSDEDRKTPKLILKIIPPPHRSTVSSSHASPRAMDPTWTNLLSSMMRRQRYMDHRQRYVDRRLRYMDRRQQYMHRYQHLHNVYQELFNTRMEMAIQVIAARSGVDLSHLPPVPVPPPYIFDGSSEEADDDDGDDQ